MIYRLNSDGYGQVSNSVALPQVSGVAVKRFFGQWQRQSEHQGMQSVCNWTQRSLSK
jgi:hypothetical protein